MKIGVLGTGMVGNAIATKLIQLGNQVKMGSRTAGNEKARAWVEANGTNALQGTFADAAAFGEILINCTNGKITLEALGFAGATNMKGKTLIDLSNPLDAGKGMPMQLFVSNTDSLGEQIQRAFPETFVVKTLNTVNNQIMVNPQLVNNGDHHLFIAGNDNNAKAQATSLLQSFGWKSEKILDLGDIKSARCMEQLLPLWINISTVLKTSKFQFKIVT